MSKTHYSRKQKKAVGFKLTLVVLVPLVLAGLGVVGVAGAFGFGAYQEEHDPFCASCHTQPETTYYQRSTGAQPVDLASAHTGQKIHCIDCHSGAGTGGRVSAEMMGAHNAFLYFTGQALQPARLTHPIDDENCLKCHSQVTTARTQNNHFHFFLARWQARDPNAARCVSCHSGHATDGTVDLMYLNEQQTTAVCASCHQVLGGGD
jgi:predicted CXXCH cytochrome family protein